MEGSTLGNAGHRFDVANTFSLKNDAGLAYYSSYKERLTENWNQFATVMDENVTDTGDQDRVIAVARDAFDGLKEIYQQLHPSIDKEMVRHVTSLNPEAGEHPMPTDPREVAAALLAGEKCWQEYPYYESRYSSRGESYTRSDSAWLAALVELEQEQVHDQMRIPDENGQRSGGKTAIIPLGKRPVFRWECGHHSGEYGQYKMRV